ncbi:MAG: SoxR reducing system RseC family protein [Spirochaetaceae bacterium]|nr:SoxR reducing system RseC family protein [Spirochaetaceae bacterium]
MTETGWVREISGDLVTLRLDRSRACSGCGYGGCRPGAPGSGTGANEECPPNHGMVTAVNRKKLPLLPGQRVAVEFPRGDAPVQAVTALLPPLLGFIAGYVLGGMALSPENQDLRAAAGGAGLFISAGLVYLIRKYLPPRKPTVIYYI